MGVKGLLFLTAVLLVAPAGLAQVGIENPSTSTPTTLYFHLDAHQDFPINTQLPDDRFAQSSNLGTGALTASCVPDASGTLNQVSKSFHTYYGFSTPGYVEYDIQQGGGPRIHPERGLSMDVQLDGSSPATLYWYLETRLLNANRPLPVVEDGLENLPTVVPQVVVEATIRTGDDVSIGSAAYNSGDIIASGATAPADLYPGAPNQIEDSEGRNLYEFAVPLTIGLDTIPKDESFNVRVDIRMEIPPCDGDKDASLMASNVRIFTDPERRPRLEWSTLNPVVIDYIHPQFVGQDLLIHTAFNSPWGNYDVDETPGGITVEVIGPSDARSLTRASFTQRTHEHDHHFEPVDVTYVWPFRLDDAVDGEYTVVVTARNDQQTAAAIGRAAFEIGPNLAFDDEGDLVISEDDGSAEESPGIGGLVAMGVLALIGLALRRRS